MMADSDVTAPSEDKLPDFDGGNLIGEKKNHKKLCKSTIIISRLLLFFIATHKTTLLTIHYF